MKKILPAILILVFMACASTQNGKLKALSEELDSKINILTYDDALIRWGEPASIVEGKNIFVVIWREEKMREVAVPWRGIIVKKQVIRGWELKLVFNKITEKMIKWDYKKLKR